jgi:hypothetical protein
MRGYADHPRPRSKSPAGRIDHALKASLATLLLSTNPAAWADEAPPAWVVEARQGAQALGQQLQQVLMRTLEESGPVAAVEVCQVQAPAIARGASSQAMQVGRTALRVRNPANTADAWEERVLGDFERRIARGEDPAGLETFVIRHADGQRQGHWMKAIPTGGMCLTCHGNALDPALQQVIEQRYPEDQATGFEPGSLRGAFSVRIDLPDPD